MRVLFLLIVIGFMNCSTLFVKPETRVSPICDFGNEKIKGLEFILTEPKKYQKNLKVSKLIDKIKEYETLKKEIIEMNLKSDEGLKVLVSLQDRIDSLRLTISVKEEKEGDLFSSQYNFTKALESYYDALHQIELSNEKNSNTTKQYDKLYKKIQISKENGENFLNNRIKSLIDQAIFLNLDDQVSKAKVAMRQAEKELESSVFINNKIVSLYVEQAKVMNFYDKNIESLCTTKMSGDMEVRNKRVPPESFLTKSGIKFKKILRKDNKPIYISDIIRPDKTDSWFFARNYAEILNLEENCPRCYQLPDYEDIENFKPNIIKDTSGDYVYEDLGGIWLNSWSLAPIGMIFGNVFTVIPWFGYTFDFLHDVATHPFTWQSYVYPISPDSISLDKDSWDNNPRLLRTAPYLMVEFKGFRIIRRMQ